MKNLKKSKFNTAKIAIHNSFSCSYSEAEFLDEIQTKVIRVFLLAIHSHMYVQLGLEISIFFTLTQLLTVSSVQLLYTVITEKGGKLDRKPIKPYHLPYGLRNPCRDLMSENSQDYAQKPQQNLYVHEFGF